MRGVPRLVAPRVDGEPGAATKRRRVMQRRASVAPTRRSGPRGARTRGTEPGFRVGRREDADDLVALRRVCDAVEIERARDAIRLIAQRGFARGRDLVGSFEHWLTAT
jgi:hypothetical protein